MEIPSFVINLNKKGKDRWTEVITHFRSDCILAIERLEGLLTSSPIGKVVLAMAERMLAQYTAGGETKMMYRSEIKAIAEMLGVSMQKVLMVQLCYEMHACCTAIVVNVGGMFSSECDFSHTRFFYRTMDWPMDFLKKLTCRLTFEKHGRTLYTAISWAGYIGVLTGMSENYGLAVNFRRSDGNLLKNATRAVEMCWPVGYLCRSLLAKGLSYKEMENALKTAPLISPCYFTLCSAIDSCVIAREPDSTVDYFSELPLIQTNKDRRGDDNNILYSRQREALAREIIDRSGTTWKGMDDIVAAFNVFPIVNHDTVYVCCMCPEENRLVCKVV